MGEILGQLFVKDYFLPKTKERYETMAENVVDAFRDHIKKLDWMSAKTKEKALAKLNKIKKKVGYPDRWKDFSTLTIDRNSYTQHVWLLTRYKFGQPVSVIIAVVPIITFAIFIFKFINDFSVLDEVEQRVQLEAVVIGFALTAMLMMLLFSLCDISNPDLFGYGPLAGYCWGFYFIGWFISKKKYGV